MAYLKENKILCEKPKSLVEIDSTTIMVGQTEGQTRPVRHYAFVSRT